MRTMRLNVAAFVAALVVGSGAIASGAVVATSADLDFIVGSGSNLSVLVIDFNDGPDSSFAWGYRWDGSASGQDLLAAISGADANLTLNSTSFVAEVSYFDGTVTRSQVSDFGAGSVSWGYYVAGGFAGDDMMNNGMVDTPTSILGGGVTLPSVYTSSPSGASGNSFGDSGRLLVDGSWDAWSFGSFDPSSFNHLVAPGPEAPQAVVVPEPSVTGFLVSLFLLCGLRRKR